jgi:dihydrolipoamide dehydrogenase
MNGQIYDLAIIGGGPGGYVAAIRAAQLDMNVILVEREHLGGVCLNWGCIPTKSLLRNAEVARLLGRGREFGFEVENVTLDYAAAIDRSRKISDRLTKGVGGLMQKHDIEVVWGSGALTSPNTVRVALNEGGTRQVSARHIILATGARARAIPGVPVDGEYVLTSRHALERRELPDSAIVIGAGPIGLEFATIWRAYGAEVTVVEMMDQILPAEDAEAAKELSRYLRRQKIKTMVSTRVEGLDVLTDEGKVRVHVSGSQDETLEADIALMAIGVRQNSEDLTLDTVGVETNNGWVTVDEATMQTNVSSIYAIGDLNSLLPLAHVASAQGILAVEHIAGYSPAAFDVNAVPRCTYTMPQVASFGLSEDAAKAQDLEVRVGKFPFLPNGKALALGENHGFVKIIAEEVSGEIVGAVIVAPEATELLPELLLAHEAELTPEEIARTVHAHPTLNEAVMEAAHAVFGEAIHI